MGLWDHTDLIDQILYLFSIGQNIILYCWSTHTSPSIISTPFHWHNVLNISRISILFSSKKTFLRNFGANTIWYLQFHFVCAKLLVALFCSVILMSSWCGFYFRNWQVTFLLYHIRSYFSILIGFSLFWTTRLSRGFLYTIKRNRPASLLLVFINI